MQEAFAQVHRTADIICRILYTKAGGPPNSHYGNIPPDADLQALIDSGREAIDPDDVMDAYRDASGGKVWHCGVPAQTHHGCTYEVAERFLLGTIKPRWEDIRGLLIDCKHEQRAVMKADNADTEADTEKNCDDWPESEEVSRLCKKLKAVPKDKRTRGWKTTVARQLFGNAAENYLRQARRYKPLYE